MCDAAMRRTILTLPVSEKSSYDARVTAIGVDEPRAIRLATAG